MMNARFLLILLVLSMAACCPTAGVVKYCQPPVRPTLVNPATIPALLGNYRVAGVYIRQLEDTVNCYEGVTK